MRKHAKNVQRTVSGDKDSTASAEAPVDGEKMKNQAADNLDVKCFCTKTTHTFYLSATFYSYLLFNFLQIHSLILFPVPEASLDSLCYSYRD